MTANAGAKALEGIRVVDLSTILMGPLAARTLGDYGADVLRMESLTGDTTRNSTPNRNPGMSGIALNIQRNKRSISLDLKHPDGRDAALAVIDSADVVISNMRRGALERLGIDPTVARQRNPGLIYCVANGFGSEGPYRDRAAYDDIIQAGSGLAWLTGERDGRPGYAPGIIADKVSGMTIVQAVLAALVHKGRTGEGQEIEVPMFETMVAFNIIEHHRGQTFEPPIDDFGYPRLMSPFRRPFKTADGWAGLLPYSDDQWKSFFAIAGRPELGDDPRFGDHNGRIENIDELYGLIDELALQRTTDDWVSRCEAASIPAMPVLDLSRAANDPHLDTVSLFEVAEHPTEGTYRHVREATRLSATPTGLHRHAPRLGEHTTEILREAGYDDETIATLIDGGVAGQPD